MEIKFNERTQKIQFSVSKDDMNHAKLLEQMLTSEGWKILQKYYEVGREEIMDAGKKGARNRSKKELSSEKWAMLDGFDQAILIPTKFVDDVNNLMEQQKKQWLLY